MSEYLSTLPAATRKEMESVRHVIRKHLPKGYVEEFRKGMIVYEVPLKRFSDTYNGEALWYAALAVQKRYLALHLVAVYGSATLRAKLTRGFEAAGKKLDIGQACVRFRTANDLALPVIGEIIASVPLEKYVEMARAARKK